MKPTCDGSLPAARTIRTMLVLIVLAAAGGCASANPLNAALNAPSSPAYTTKAAREGSITLATSGSVTLMARQEEELAFTVSGTVAELNAASGERVKAGDVLAQLDSLPELEAEVKTAAQNLLSAQQDLAAFKVNSPANLASAQLKVIEAQQAVEDARGGVVQKDWERCDQETKDKLLDRYNRAVAQLDALGDGGGNADYYLNTILPQKMVVDLALGAYQSCAGYTDYQAAASQGSLTVAQANLALAEDTLADLTANGGLDPTALQAAENSVASAQQALDAAREDLAGATLNAPFDGTVLTVAGKVGDTITVDAKNPASTFLTIADLDHPLLQFSIDEMDLSMAAKGEAALVTFDAFPNRTFHGVVTRIDPALSSLDGISTVTGQIELDLSQETDLPAFPKNLSGSAQIIQAAAENVLVIPVEALREAANGSQGVYVLGSGSLPVWKPVSVGLRNAASVEIRSGLELGELVVTSPVE